jgi:hypothetical protein
MDERELSAAFLGFVAALIVWLVIVSLAPSFGGFAIIAGDHSVVVADSDVVSYSAYMHEFTITAGCAARLESSRYIEGAFTVVIYGETLLTGIFVPSVVSRSYPPSYLVITYPGLDLNYDKIKLQMGYPLASQGVSEVDDSAIISYLTSTGRITP